MMRHPRQQRKSVTPIILGICAMDKKAKSKPMQEIIARLDPTLFIVVIFGDDCILNQPIEEWPRVDCLIAFYSNGYPLEKASEYVELRKPYLINDLKMQNVLQDRRKVYEMLIKHNIAVPSHVYAERDIPGKPCIVEDCDEWILVNGKKVMKPLVEKPVDADDHNIRIYYPMSAGGGSKRLFRKVGDRSSEFYRHENEVRKEGSYIYEEFLNTQGTDVKVYTVGADYGHAEARKSPVVDGKVQRDAVGLEVRYPVILSSTEKEISRTITLAFKQTVCGFDFLRIPGGKSYVCDVNGWSFVKKNRKYYDDCSRILSETMLLALRPTYHPTLSTVSPLMKSLSFGPSQSPEIYHNHLPNMDSNLYHKHSNHNDDNTSERKSTGSLDHTLQHDVKGSNQAAIDCLLSDSLELDSDEDDEELLCVISVIRHGDRTPKQKMKVEVLDPRYLEYFTAHSQHPKQNLKLKSKSSLEEFLEVTKTILREGPTKWYGNTVEMCVKLQRIKEVLEQEVISGVNRKLQLKPKKWVQLNEITADGTLQIVTKVSHLMIILKWGGVLTPLGESQSEKLGATFRTTMYPDPSGGGVLRLHATFRHDLKIRSSDEGRVMKTAAAFTKGLLELEGDLTPVLVSLVSVQESNLLDHSDNKDIKEETDKIKQKLSDLFQADRVITSDLLNSMAPLGNRMMREALLQLHNPRQTLQVIHSIVNQLCEQIRQFIHDFFPPSSSSCCPPSSSDTSASSSTDPPQPTPQPQPTSKIALYLNETPYLMLYRWETLCRDFYSPKKNSYDLSKVPEIHDMTRYDTLHNSHLPFVTLLYQLYSHIDIFAKCIVPQEYGINLKQKQKISHMMCYELLKKISNDLQRAQSGSQLDMHYLLDHSHADDLDIRSLGRNVRTRLYFTSESHLYTLLNVLQYPLHETISLLPSPVTTPGLVSSSSSPSSSLSTASQPSNTPPTSYLLNENGKLALENICELSYLTQINFRLFDITSKGQDDPDKYRCEISLSAGVVSDPCVDKSGTVSETHLLNSHVRCRDLLLCLAGEYKSAVRDRGNEKEERGVVGNTSAGGGEGSDDGTEC